MTDLQRAAEYLKPGAIVPVDIPTTALLVNALREALAEPPTKAGELGAMKRDFWEGYVPEPVKPAQQALDKKAENARELGLDYEPSAGTQVSKVWWDGEKLMAQPIPLDQFYKEPAQRTWVGLTDEEKSDLWCESTGRDCVNEDTHVFADAIEAKLKEKNT